MTFGSMLRIEPLMEYFLEHGAPWINLPPALFKEHVAPGRVPALAAGNESFSALTFSSCLLGFDPLYSAVKLSELTAKGSCLRTGQMSRQTTVAGSMDPSLSRE